MGVVRKHMFEMFPPARNASRDPTFSNQFREDLAQDEGLRREQRITDLEDRQIRQQERAQRAVNQFTRQPASTREQFLEDRPEIALSPQFGNVQDYQRQNMAARTLAPSMASKLPPVAARRFYENIDGGMAATDAFEEARDFLDQENLREKLYSTGADDAEIEKVFPKGTRLSTPEVARFQTQRKISLGQDPETDALSKLHSILRGQVRQQVDSTGLADPETEAEMESVGMLLRERLKAKAFKPEASVPDPTGAPAGVAIPGGTKTPAQPAIPATAPQAAKTPMSYQELVRKSKEAAQPVDPEVETINKAWTQAKQAMQKELDAIVPDKVIKGTDVNQREAFARAILDGEMAELPELAKGEIPVEGGAPKEPLAWATLRQMGMSPEDVVFEEPGNRRFGTQKVKAPDVLKAWAQDFLNSRGKLLTPKESPTGSVLSEEAQKAVEDFDKKFQIKK